MDFLFLNRFPEAVLSCITQKLLLKHALRLYLTGDRLLHAKFDQGGVKSLKYEDEQHCVPNAGLKPFSRVTSYYHDAGAVLFAPVVVNSEIARLPESLTSLELEADAIDVDFTVLPHLRRLKLLNIEMQTLTSLFPATLRTLYIIGSQEIEKTMAVLEVTPPSLVSVRLGFYHHQHHRPQDYEEVLNRLTNFAELTKLYLGFSKDVPDHLPRLLPRALTKLTLYRERTASQPKSVLIDLTELPPQIVRLSLSSFTVDFSPRCVSSLNRHMTLLKLDNVVAPGLELNSIKALPSALHTFQMVISTLGDTRIGLESDMIGALPASLLHLDVRVKAKSKDDHFVFPRKLNFLDLRNSAVPSLRLPVSVSKVLHLVLLEDDSKGDPLMPSQTGEGLSQLVDLDVELELGPRISHLSAFPNHLTSLRLVLRAACPLLFTCLPKSLLNFDLHYRGVVDFSVAPDTWLTDLPSLRRFNFIGQVIPVRFVLNWKQEGREMGKLKKLNLSCTGPMDQVLQCIPASVTDLTLTASRPGDMKAVMEALPPKLKSFSGTWLLPGPPPDFDPSLLQLLPPRVTYFLLPTASSPDSRQKISLAVSKLKRHNLYLSLQ